MYKSILLAADGSEYSLRAAKEALNFTGTHTVITILNVLETEATKYDFLHRKPGEKKLRELRLKPIQSVIDFFEENNVNYEVRLEQGNPTKKVVNIANEGTYDAIVIGSRGLNAFQEMMLGSVSHKVAKKAEIPVIIVK